MLDKKQVCICIPCFNEVDNVIPLAESVIELFERNLPQYNYIIQFIDNNSIDGTKENLMKLCDLYPQIRAIFNAKNFKGHSALYGLLQSTGDCAIYLSADFQDPIEKIPELLNKWEEGYKIVAAIKKPVKENVFISRSRKIYYGLMHKYSEVGFIEQFCNFGVYDRTFLDILRKIKRLNYSIRGNVAEYGYNICFVEYEQQKRRSGKSNYNVISLCNLAITNFIDYTNVLLKFAIFAGGFGCALSFLASMYFFVRKIIWWEQFAMGVAPILIGVFFVGGINLFLLGIIGEYVLSVRRQLKDSPFVIEEKRLNFDSEKK